MASLGTEDERLVFTLQVLGKVPRRGLVDDGPVGMNSDLGLLRLRFIQALDNQAWLNREIMVFEETLRNWTGRIQALVAEGKHHQEVGWDNQICPHLLLHIRRQEWKTYHGIGETRKEEIYTEYEFFAGLASTYLLGSGGEWGTGPGVWFEVDGPSLAAFARKLEEEMDTARNDP